MLVFKATQHHAITPRPPLPPLPPLQAVVYVMASVWCLWWGFVMPSETWRSEICLLEVCPVSLRDKVWTTHTNETWPRREDSVSIQKKKKSMKIWSKIVFIYSVYITATERRISWFFFPRLVLNLKLERRSMMEFWICLLSFQYFIYDIICDDVAEILF